MEYKLKDLIDIPRMQEVFKSFDEIYSITSAIVDMEGNVLLANSWQDVCTKFHRINPETVKKCNESDTHFEAELNRDAPHIIYKCPMGLIDAACPIVVDGVHLGNVFTGQLFLEPPDESKFAEQACQYGFDVAEYVAAMRKVPLISEAQLHKNLSFIHSLTLMTAEQALQQKRTLETAEQLHRSEEFLRSVIETLPVPLALNDSEGNITYLNKAFINTTGYTLDDVRTVNDWFQLAYPDEEYRRQIVNTWSQHLDNVLHTGKPFEPMEITVVCKDSKKRDFICSTSVLENDSSATHLVFFYEITDSKQAELELKHSHELMHYIIQHNQSALAVHDKDMHYIYVSERYLQDYKVKEKDIIGKHHYEVFPDLPQKWRDVHQRALEGVISSSEEDSYERADGSIEWTRWECRPWYDANGTIGGIIVYTEVITERKKAEEHRLSLQNQLQQAQKIESIGRLAGGVAHDFNNMLSIIMGHAELGLMQCGEKHPIYENLREIKNSAERSADLTRQLLAFARKQTVAPKIIDLNETVSGLLKMLERLIGEAITIRWVPAPDLWQVKIDTSQLDQILANLCVNARDAISDIGKIIIETHNISVDEAFTKTHMEALPGEYVLLTVSDSGCGMSKELLANIFEPFFTTKELGKGTGLGLATVYGAVKQNNGFIDVYSELGTGTTFKIYLPRSKDKSISATTEIQAEPAKGHETILLVEDEPAILAMTKAILSKIGYNVLAAATPGEAMKFAREYNSNIHLLMTDVIMPEMNGRDLAKNIVVLYPGIKRLFMSGYTADVIAHHGVLEDGVHFLQKPFNMNALSGKIREVLD